MKIIKPVELAEKSLKQLYEMLEKAYKHLDQQTDKGEQLRDAFVYRHARNVHSIGQDLLELERLGRTGSSHLLIRPMLESVFRLVAACKVRGFAVEKVVAEVEEDCERLTKWAQRFPESDADGRMTQTITELKNLSADLRKEHSLSTKRRWTVLDCAAVADLNSHYVRHYFMYSRNVHSTVQGIIIQEGGSSRGFLLETAIFLFIMAAAYTPMLLDPPAAAQKGIDEATELLEQLKGLVEQGAFVGDPDFS